MLCDRKILLLLAVANVTFALVPNVTETVVNVLKTANDTRRSRGKGGRSTSSSSGEAGASGSAESRDHGDESLGLSDSGVESSGKEDKGKEHLQDLLGWRKYHRTCTPCPEEMAMNYKNRRLQWICGAYQRARRTFKSSCMMHYRNCQDGTMFVKISHGFCNMSSNAPVGDHFFYDYRARDTDDSADTGGSSRAISDEMADN